MILGKETRAAQSNLDAAASQRTRPAISHDHIKPTRRRSKLGCSRAGTDASSCDAARALQRRIKQKKPPMHGGERLRALCHAELRHSSLFCVQRNATRAKTMNIIHGLLVLNGPIGLLSGGGGESIRQASQSRV